MKGLNMRLFLFLMSVFYSTYCFAKPPVILISIDGFAFKYLEKYKPKHLLAFAKQGVKAKGLIPVFPSKTFPNHLSIVTGNYPYKHGIVHNSFYHRKLNQNYTLGAGKDQSKWLTAKPIWITAIEQGLITGVYFWPESETRVSGLLPNYFFPYKHNTPNAERLNQVVEWLKLPENKKPHFIATYFSTVDSIGHEFGLESKELAASIHEIDELIGQFLRTIKHENIEQPNILIVSDHGMAVTYKKHQIQWKTLLPNHQQLKVVNGGTQLYVYESNHIMLDKVEKQLLSLPLNQQIEIFKKGEYPEHWHLNHDLEMIPDLIVNAKNSTTFVDEKTYESKSTHGYDPKDNDDLLAIFLAAGPSFKKGAQISPFENIHIYSLLERLLGLDISEDKDSKKTVLADIVLPTKQ